MTSYSNARNMVIIIEHIQILGKGPGASLQIILTQNLFKCIIVNRGDWLGSPANIRGTNKDAKIYVERSATLHNLLFSPHTLCMNYVTNTFLLVSSSVQSKQLLCFVQGQGQKTEQ